MPPLSPIPIPVPEPEPYAPVVVAPETLLDPPAFELEVVAEGAVAASAPAPSAAIPPAPGAAEEEEEEPSIAALLPSATCLSYVV